MAVGGELNNLADQGIGGSVGKSVAKNGQKALEAGIASQQQATSVSATGAPAAVTVFGSGNLAPVYFHFSQNRVSRLDLDATYPGLFTALKEHEGIGAIVAYEADGTPMVWWKNGTRDLRTGTVEGEDPLKMYGDPAVRSEQLCRLADFPHNGDLTVFSTVYKDGTVAAMEELIGSHGGMGGVQTDAFMFHAPDIAVPPTTNATDVFKILDARRRAPCVPPPAAPKTSQADDWAPGNIGKGIAQAGKWLPLAVRAVLLNARAYGEIIRDPLMTGPALLIGVLAPIVAGLVARGGFNLDLTLQYLLRWLVATLVIFATGRILTGGAKAKKATNYTQVFRGLGFAQGALILELLALVAPLAPFARGLSTLLCLIASWLAATVAFNLRGWRAVLFPIVMLVVFVLSVVTISVLVQGAALSLTTLAEGLGIAR